MRAKWTCERALGGALLGALMLASLSDVAAGQALRKGPYLIYPGLNTEMQVLWQLNAVDTCTIEWGTDMSYSLGSEETVEYGGDHQHTYTITGLAPGTLYYYHVTVAGEEYTGSFRAAPAADAHKVKFMAYGDTRTYPADHNGVAASIISEYVSDPEFQSMLISMGDLVTDGDLESEWDTEFFDPAYSSIQTMLATLPYQSAMGNHEESGVLFTKYFPYPFVSDRYWSFDYGPAHFVVVDQYTSYGAGSAQLSWIDSDLAATPKPWKFVYLHEPGWSAGGHPNNATVQGYIQPLCEAYGVAIVFAGHNHYYARALVNGIHHVTTGGGGAPLTSPNLTYPYVVTGVSAYNYCKIDIDGGFLDFIGITRSGTVIDTFSLNLPQAGLADADGRALVPGFDLSLKRSNPFSDGTVMSFSVPEVSHVELCIYATDGRKIRTLVDGVREAGYHDVEWHGKDDSGGDVSSGIYFGRLEARGRSITKKLILAR